MCTCVLEESWTGYHGKPLAFPHLPRSIAVHDGVQYAVPFRVTPTVHHLPLAKGTGCRLYSYQCETEETPADVRIEKLDS